MCIIHIKCLGSSKADSFEDFFFKGSQINLCKTSNFFIETFSTSPYSHGHLENSSVVVLQKNSALDTHVEFNLLYQVGVLARWQLVNTYQMMLENRFLCLSYFYACNLCCDLNSSIDFVMLMPFPSSKAVEEMPACLDFNLCGKLLAY